MKFQNANLKICEKYNKDINEVFDSVLKFSKYPPHIQSVINYYFSESYKPSGKISISVYFPYWLSENCSIDRKIKKSIHMAGIYYSHYIRTQDIVIDNSENFEHNYTADIIIAGNIFLMKSIEILRNVFPTDSEFWVLHDRYMLEYWDSIVWENKFVSTIKSWSDKNLKRLRFKLSPLKISVAAFTQLAHSQSVLPSFERLIDCYQIGMQMLDDIEDWKEDLANSRYTYFLSLIFSNVDTKSMDYLSQINPADIGSALNDLFDICIHYFLDAYDLASGLKLNSMKEFLRYLIDVVINLKRITKNSYKEILDKGISKYFVFYSRT